MRTDQLLKLSQLERAYCHTPADLDGTLRLAVLGSGLGLSFVWRLIQYLESTDRQIDPGQIAVFERGPLDVLDHLGNSGLPRIQLQETAGLARMGGRTPMFGGWCPRPAEDRLSQWPHDLDSTCQNFDDEERELGILEAIPLSGRRLDRDVTDRLSRKFSPGDAVREIRAGPLAINAAGHRWSSLDRLADILERGVTIIPHAQIHRLERDGSRVAAVHGGWFGHSFLCNPQVVVASVGVENTLALLGGVLPRGVDLIPGDHIRIDMSGWLPANHFAVSDPEELGVSALYMRCRSLRAPVDFHLQVKTAPKRYWSRYMPGGDNLQSDPNDSRILFQIQGVGQLNERLRCSSVVRDLRRIHADVSLSDMHLHVEIAEIMDRAAAAIGLELRRPEIRPLTLNHHLHGLLRINRGLTPELAVDGLENLYVLAPTAYPDSDDDANPVLKSLVVNRFAVKPVADACWPILK